MRTGARLAVRAARRATATLHGTRLSFFFDFACPYSYLASVKLHNLLREEVRRGLDIQWVPWVDAVEEDVAPGAGGDAGAAAVQAYTLRDVERTAALDGTRLVLPDGFPHDSAPSALAFLAVRERSGPDHARMFAEEYVACHVHLDGATLLSRARVGLGALRRFLPALSLPQRRSRAAPQRSQCRSDEDAPAAALDHYLARNSSRLCCDSLRSRCDLGTRLYRHSFAGGVGRIDDRETLARVGAAVGAAPEWITEACDAAEDPARAPPDLSNALVATQERAQQLGVFAAPSFVIQQSASRARPEIFFGESRLPHAVLWLRQGGW